MQKQPGARSDDQCPQPFTLNADLASLDAALARDHAAQARAEAGSTAKPAESFAAALASAGEAGL